MNIYTSYFGFLKHIPETIIPVSIAQYPPKWYDGYELKSLAPSKKLLGKAKSGKVTEQEYAAQYMAEIQTLFTPESLYKKLKGDFNGKDIVLLCFEKKGEFCHRRLVAKWFEDNLNISITEI